MHQGIVQISAALLLISVGGLAGCDEKKPSSDDGHGHTHGPNDQHAAHPPDAEAKQGAHTSSGAGHGGKVIALGSQVIDGFNAAATRDEGLIIAGKDAPIDVTITSTDPGNKVASVRFWIGTKDAQGSVKAKAEVENANDPNRWHTHVEIPDPLPVGSQVWVEVETVKGTTVTGAFDLKN